MVLVDKKEKIFDINFDGVKVFLFANYVLVWLDEGNCKPQKSKAMITLPIVFCVTVYVAYVSFIFSDVLPLWNNTTFTCSAKVITTCSLLPAIAGGLLSAAFIIALFICARPFEPFFKFIGRQEWFKKSWKVSLLGPSYPRYKNHGSAFDE